MPTGKSLFASVLLLSSLVVMAACERSVVLAPTGPPKAATECRSCSYYDDLPSTFYYFSAPATQTEWVIQDQVDWDNFLAATDLYGYHDPVPPVDLDVKTLIAKFITTSCGPIVVPRDICIGPDRVTVTYDIDEGCCEGYIFLFGRMYVYALDKTHLPVVWKGTVVPYEGPPCPTPVPYPWIDPPLIPYTGIDGNTFDPGLPFPGGGCGQ